MARQKDIQYASRADSHIARQKQIHRLRHVIRELHKELPASRQADEQGQGAGLVGLRHDDARGAPAGAARRRRGPDQGHRLHARAGIRTRRRAGYTDTLRMIERAPWKTATVDPIEGVIEHL